MTHPKFGSKFTCWNCAARFYDMRKPEPRCPKCASDPRDDPTLKSSDRGSKKGKGDEFSDSDELEEETFEADMDELVNDEDEAEDDGSEMEELGADEE